MLCHVLQGLLGSLHRGVVLRATGLIVERTCYVMQLSLVKRTYPRFKRPAATSSVW